MTFKGLDLSLRSLRRSGTFLAVALATLAISMGAAITMFVVINSFLLSSLPYRDADRLVMIWNDQKGGTEGEIEDELPLSPGAFTDLQERDRSFEQLAAFLTEAVNVTEPDGTSRLHSLIVTGDFFPTLGVQAAIGRVPGPEDARSDAAPVVAISHDLWQRRYGGDPAILEQDITFGGLERQVVGVLPAGFRFSESLVAADRSLSKPVDLWVPFSTAGMAEQRGFHFLMTLGRLKPGVSLAAAEADLDAYATMAAQRFPETDELYGLRVVPLREQIFGSLRPVLLALWAATLLILLIACVNLATLLLARMHRKRRDTAVRLALGARRSRVVFESLLESIGLSLLGGLLSLGVALLAIRLLTALSPVNVFQSYPPQIDPQVILFTVGLSLLAGFLFGALPALRASRTDFAVAIGEERARLSRRSQLAFSVLVTVQMALATTLLIAMGLSFKSFQGLLRADLGAQLDNVVTFEMFLPRFQYREESRKVDFLRDLMERIEVLPGVESVGMNYGLPFSGVDPSNGFEIEGRPARAGESLSANLGLVNAAYFETLGIPLLRGRSFLPTDTADATPVAIVDERMVEQYFGSEDPLGRRISIAGDTPLTLVGVVGAVQQDAFEDVARPYVYLPYRQRSYMFTTFAIKTSLENPLSLGQPVREILRDLDKGVPISTLTTLEDLYSRALSPQRFTLLLMSVFAGVALFLTVVGTYGAMSFLVRQREQEAGIRMALGATPEQIFGLVFKQGLLLSLLGTAIGLALAVAAGRILANLAYGVQPHDLMVFGVVPVVTLLAAFIAYYPPARSLSRVDPRESLSST